MDSKLTFYSYTQTGLSFQTEHSVDEFGIPSSLNPTVKAGIKISGDNDFITQSFPLRGAGDVSSFDTSQIIKVEPKSNSCDFEPNFFPFIEFVSPEFPWLFSHGKVTNKGRLCPWLALIVLKKEDNFILETTKSGTRKAIYIKEKARDILPAPQDLCMWTHVQSMTLPDRKGQELTTSFSRMVAARRLDKNTAYQAFLVPCFEAGRLAGLGQDIASAGDNFAWNTDTDTITLPYYYSWGFQTGEADFEDLVRRLLPYQADETVGLHDLDISTPRGGLNLADLNLNLPQGKRITLSFEGALISPIAATKKWRRDHKTKFQSALEKMILTDGDTIISDSEDYNALAHDPVVSAPLYGRWQKELAYNITRQELPTWANEINFNPCHRSMAGTGVRVIRKNQETYMAEAWEFARNADTVQQEIRHARFAHSVGKSIHNKMSALKDDTWLRITTPVNSRMKEDGKKYTIQRTIEKSNFVPTGTVEAGFRRFAKSQDKKLNFQAKLSGEVASKTASDKKVIQNCITAAPSISSLAIARSYETLSISKSYEISSIQTTTPTTTRRTSTRRTSATRVGMGTIKLSSPKTLKTKELTSLNKTKLMPTGIKSNTIVSTPAVKTDIDLKKIATASRNKTNPDKAIGSEIFTRVTGVERPKTKNVIIPKQVKASLEFDQPAYQDLQKLNPEFFLPGFGSIPENSISLLQTNPTFIQSYLAGMNNEMSRELAWREYPAELDNTWFRKFWDYIDTPDQKDIKPISNWGKNNKLGSSALSASATAGEENIVLLIKGDLLKFYPNTQIYAVKAKWEKKDTDNTDSWNIIDRTLPKASHNKVRKANISDENIRLPLFKGKIGAEAHFIGFSLTDEILRGSANPADKDPGWFFVFEENISEPRFGLDVAQDYAPDRRPANYEDLSWGHFADSASSLSALNFAPIETEWKNRMKFQDGSVWGKNSADMAKITYQLPVRILFHADTLLAKEEG